MAKLIAALLFALLLIPLALAWPFVALASAWARRRAKRAPRFLDQLRRESSLSAEYRAKGWMDDDSTELATWRRAG